VTGPSRKKCLAAPLTGVERVHKHNNVIVMRIKIRANSGVATLSAALSTLQICLQEFEMKEHHVSCLLKIFQAFLVEITFSKTKC